MMYSSGLGTPYWYEWEVGILECLNMMTDLSVQSVEIQSEDFQHLDDVVINYIDGSITNIQVKHTDVDENFTYSTLTSGKEPMLKKWFTEWHKVKNRYSIREIRIVTNRKWGPQKNDGKCSFKDFVEIVFPCLQSDYTYRSDDSTVNAAIDWFKQQIASLGNDAHDFVRILHFCQEDDLPEVEDKIRHLIATILGTEKEEIIERSTNTLLAKLSRWATSRRNSPQINRESVCSALCTSSIDPPNYEIYPEKPIYPSREIFADSFLSTIQSSDKKMIFLQGLPGSGKTNFVSYIAQKENSIVDFRFYTYLPVNKDYPTYSDDEGFYTGALLWRSLLTQLKKYFEKHNLLSSLHFPLIYNYLSTTEMREAVLKFLPEYARIIGRTCYIFIDGLDHATRSKDSRNSFLQQLPMPQEINGDIKIVFGWSTHQ